MDKSTKILSDITIYSKYAKYDKKKKRRETWEELCYRNMGMQLDKYPQLYGEIVKVYNDFVIPKKVLPSMRSLQFGGRPVELSPNRIFNCAYMPVDHYKAFSESMFLLLGGSGVGYSVQSHHVAQLPEIKKPLKKRRYVVADSIVGWADAVKILLEAYMRGKSLPIFDFSDIRPKGAELITSGGKAPGHEPLEMCLFQLKRILDRKQDGEKLTTLEAHDMMCFIADAVLSGGIRRAALISLFDIDDNDMLTCKFGNWWEENPQRGRANNSAMVIRHKITEEKFQLLWDKIKASGSGEPGIYFSNNTEWGTNPCCEIALRNNQFCNLTEINASDVLDQDDLEARARAASFLGTLQAGYTDFHYLRDVWKRNTEKDALIGVGMTGIASGAVLSLDLRKKMSVLLISLVLTRLPVLLVLSLPVPLLWLLVRLQEFTHGTQSIISETSDLERTKPFTNT
jgi:ribonucleoside-triphosphate reductase